MLSEETSIIAITTTCKLPNIISQDAPALLLHSDTIVHLAPWDIQAVKTGIQICLPTGYYAELRPVRSMITRFIDAKVEIVETVGMILFTTYFLIILFVLFFTDQW